MIESILGSTSKEQVLVFITARGESYAREIADFYNVSLSPIQKQLDRLEQGGILASKTAGKTRLYFFNTRYAFYKELSALLNKILGFLHKEEKESLLNSRRRPRRRLKPLSINKKG